MRQRVKANLSKRLHGLQKRTLEELNAIFDEYHELMQDPVPEKKKKSKSRSPVESSSEQEEELHLYDSDGPDDDDDEEEESSSLSNEEKVIDLGQDDQVNPYDERMLKQMIEKIRLSNFKQGLDSSLWFDRRYGYKLKMIRSGMGNNANLAHEIFDDMRNQWAHISVEKLLMVTSGKCCMCNTTRPCSHRLRQDEETYTLGKQCAQLAKALVAFFDTMSQMVDEERNCSLEALDKCFAKVLEAHAGKSGNQ